MSGRQWIRWRYLQRGRTVLGGRRARRVAEGVHPAAGLDYALGQAAALLASARRARNSPEVNRLLEWIDAHLDERLQLMISGKQYADRQRHTALRSWRL